MLLNNGIVSENDIKSKNNRTLEIVNDYISQINLMFTEDNRYLDFSPLVVALSIVSFVCQLFKFDSWNNYFSKIYLKSSNIFNANLNQDVKNCLIVIERYDNYIVLK